MSLRKEVSKNLLKEEEILCQGKVCERVQLTELTTESWHGEGEEVVEEATTTYEVRYFNEGNDLDRDVFSSLEEATEYFAESVKTAKEESKQFEVETIIEEIAEEIVSEINN